MGHHLQNRRRSDKSGQPTPKKVVSLVADTNGQKVVVYDGHHFKQTPDRNGALLFRCVRYETTKCPANILVTKRTKTIGLPHNHEDLATNEMPITSGRKVQVSSEKYAQIPSEKKGEIQFENKAQISSENKVHTPIRSNEKALSKGNLQIHSIQKVSKISVNRQKMTGVHLQLKKHKNRKVGSSAQKQSQSGSSNVDRDLPGKNGQYFDQNLSLNDFQSIFKQHFNIKD